MHRAMVDLRTGKISPDEFRSVMAASRESRSEKEHHAAKSQAAAAMSA
jgi:hypothetical protein